MRRFGPSGSWNKKNSVLEHANAVITRIARDAFFESMFMLYIIKYFALRFVGSVPCCVGRFAEGTVGFASLAGLTWLGVHWL
jgi:hypothetical protein